MHPFTIATTTMHYAQNLFIRVFTDSGFYGVGECSAFPMIVGETQATCYEMAKDFAGIWKGKDPLELEARMAELDGYTAFNETCKSAFDMALYDIGAKHAGMPLYRFLGAKGKKDLETDITVGIGSPQVMATQALAFREQGFRIIKIKLGKEPAHDVERVRSIRGAVGKGIKLRIDANQGWSFEDAQLALAAMEEFDIEFCEQPMRHWNDEHLPALRKMTSIKIMADESVFDHHDAQRLIRNGACDSINIKLAKSGGILEAIKINSVSQESSIPCMMGGMLESRVALSAFAHFATAHDNVIYYDMDTCMLGHKADPVTGGVRYNGFLVELPDTAGIGADIDEDFLKTLQQVVI